MASEGPQPAGEHRRRPLADTHPELASQIREVFLDGVASVVGSSFPRGEVAEILLVDLGPGPEGAEVILIEVPGFDDEVWWTDWSGDRQEALRWADDAGVATGANLIRPAPGKATDRSATLEDQPSPDPASIPRLWPFARGCHRQR